MVRESCLEYLEVLGNGQHHIWVKNQRMFRYLRGSVGEKLAMGWVTLKKGLKWVL